MSLLLKHLRHKYSPAARRGREAARKHTARLEYEGWVAAQKKAFQPDDRTAPTKPYRSPFANPGGERRARTTADHGEG